MNEENNKISTNRREELNLTNNGNNGEKIFTPIAAECLASETTVDAAAVGDFNDNTDDDDGYDDNDYQFNS